MPRATDVLTTNHKSERTAKRPTFYAHIPSANTASGSTKWFMLWNLNTRLSRRAITAAESATPVPQFNVQLLLPSTSPGSVVQSIGPRVSADRRRQTARRDSNSRSRQDRESANVLRPHAVRPHFVLFDEPMTVRKLEHKAMEARHPLEEREHRAPRSQPSAGAPEIAVEVHATDAWKAGIPQHIDDLREFVAREIEGVSCVQSRQRFEINSPAGQEEGGGNGLGGDVERDGVSVRSVGSEHIVRGADRAGFVVLLGSNLEGKVYNTPREGVLVDAQSKLCGEFEQVASWRLFCWQGHLHGLHMSFPAGPGKI
ncbi:hypothetical protein B0H11DRAFT_2190639 [Mycena galericulata]|nr:hypothetical protein B0H11DRAFT_2190639 [Mycena galericulata]